MHAMPENGHMRPERIQISLYTRAVWSGSSLGEFYIAKDATFLRADNENSDQTARTAWVQMSKGTFSDDAVHIRRISKTRLLEHILVCHLLIFTCIKFCKTELQELAPNSVP